MSTWKKLGEGTYNTVYVDSTKSKVLKIQKDLEDKTDLPERSVRLWNLINHDLSPKAYVTDSVYGQGWISPYIEGQQASDHEIAQIVIDIFNKTGRIVTDATAPRNIIRTDAGKIICVDIGMALELEKRESVVLKDGRKRRNSIVSLDSWKKNRTEYFSFFTECTGKYPKSVNTIKALLFIKMLRPDIFVADFILEKKAICDRLANAYDRHIDPTWASELDATLVWLDSLTGCDQIEDAIDIDADPLNESLSLKEGEKTLSSIDPNLASIKERCIIELKKYISSRGSFNSKLEFVPTWTSSIFRNVNLSRNKATAVLDLMAKIDKATDQNQIHELIVCDLENEYLNQGRFSRGFEFHLFQCLSYIEKTDYNMTSSPFCGLC